MSGRQSEFARYGWGTWSLALAVAAVSIAGGSLAAMYYSSLLPDMYILVSGWEVDLRAILLLVAFVIALLAMVSAIAAGASSGARSACLPIMLASVALAWTLLALLFALLSG